MKIFFSLSERMYLMKAKPVPIRARVMNSSAPFRLCIEMTRTIHTIAASQPIFILSISNTHTHLQVSDVVHYSPAFDRMPLHVDEVIVNLNDRYV